MNNRGAISIVGVAMAIQVLTLPQVLRGEERRPLRDPFEGPRQFEEKETTQKTALLAEKPTVPILTLRATLVSAVPLADINGRILGIGDEIEGYKVISIIEDRVSLERGGELLVLELSVD